MAKKQFVDIQGAAYIAGLFKTRAPKESPEFIGTPKAPTPATSSNDEQIATTAFVQAAIANGVEGVYTPKGAVDTLDDLPQPPDVQPGDIYTVKEDIVETPDGQERKLTGTVTDFADLPTDAPTGAIYKVENAFTDVNTGTEYEAGSFWIATNDGTTATWDNLAGAKLYPAGSDWKYTENDGYVPMANAIDLSAYETEGIPVSELEKLFEPEKFVTPTP